MTDVRQPLYGQAAREVRDQLAATAPTTGVLPGPVAELLAAVHAALDVPLADRPVDDKQRAELLTRRAADTRVILELLLVHGDIARSVERLRQWTAEHPVTYPTWQARSEQAAAEEERLLDTEPTSLPGKTAGGRSSSQEEERCPAAHPQDPDACSGPTVVTVLAADNSGLDGCEHHGARLLASLDGGRVYPLPDAPDGAAIRVFKAAAITAPYAWVERGEAR
jgi:hypothetical protein